ncbi:MAG: T9SS type A sorting domain-containing protein, partial [Ignavibacterium sp.]|nr:T9SS type A sorting domain-containing protein [Ignavibacterium sp.]
MKKFYILILILFLSAFHYSQTISISGNIKDLAVNSPIEGAKVQIKNVSNGMVDSVFSDAVGNWQYDIATSIEDDINYLPTNLEVMQNFPNPFNPSTKIGFLIPSDEIVSISVHNILGELIDFRSSFLTKGNYVVDWYSKGSAGVYFYTITYGNQSITKKMIQLDGGNGIGLGEIRSGISNRFSSAAAVQVYQIEIVITKFSYAADTTIVDVAGGENFS